LPLRSRRGPAVATARPADTPEAPASSPSSSRGFRRTEHRRLRVAVELVPKIGRRAKATGSPFHDCKAGNAAAMLAASPHLEATELAAELRATAREMCAHAQARREQAAELREQAKRLLAQARRVRDS
jgi:flagellar biosynthesis/type III secretory pathway protein FliH